MKTSDMVTKGSTKYDPSGAKVRKFGGNKAIHDGVRSAAPKYGKVGTRNMQRGKGMS